MLGSNEECLRWMTLWNNNIIDNISLSDNIELTDLDYIVLSQEQIDIIPFLNEFSKDFFLVWWTAIALHLWHRKSIDFDMFTFHKILKPSEIINLLEKHNLIDVIDKDNLNDLKHMKTFWSDEWRTEYILYINNVQIQFVFLNIVINEWDWYNFNINTTFFNTIKSIDLEQLIWMKMFALIYRNKWKDIVDLYLMFKKLNISLDKAFEISYKMYWNMFNKDHVIDRIFQNTWNKSEEIEFLWKYADYKNIHEDEIFNYFNKLISQ